MKRHSQKYPKLKFEVHDYDGSAEGEFIWGHNRSEIFERFYEADEIREPDVACRELFKIIHDDPEFLDAYNSLGWWEFNAFNYGNALTHFDLAFSIGSKLIPTDFKGTILWGFLDNRPFLRTMHGLALNHEMIGDYEKADRLCQKILAYNPNDNQGIRALAIENKLFMGDYQGVLKICKLFPDDTLPDTLFGKVVAHYKLGQMDRALSTLKEAIKISPNVAIELIKKKHKKIQGEMPGSITVGGEDEAYDYWKRTRIVWNDPALLDFIKGSLS